MVRQEVAIQREPQCTLYQELGANYFDQRHVLRTTKRLVKRLQALGHRVILESPLPNTRIA
jgi:hypothetical protein